MAEDITKTDDVIMKNLMGHFFEHMSEINDSLKKIVEQEGKEEEPMDISITLKIE